MLIPQAVLCAVASPHDDVVLVEVLVIELLGNTCSQFCKHEIQKACVVRSTMIIKELNSIIEVKFTSKGAWVIAVLRDLIFSKMFDTKIGLLIARRSASEKVSSFAICQKSP